MIAIGIDTATDRLSVAARRGDRTVRRMTPGARRHARALAGLIEELLIELGAGWDQVDSLVVADGPGSFTGLRVGTAFAKGASRARAIPVFAASTLLVRAWGGAGELRPAVVAGVASALRGEIYAALYRFTAEGVEHLAEPRVLPPGAPLGAVAPDLVVGDLPAAALGQWPWTEGAAYVSEAAGYPAAEHLLDLRAVPGGASRIDDVAGWEPDYGRPAEAQARWERAHGRPLDDQARDRR